MSFWSSDDEDDEELVTKWVDPAVLAEKSDKFENEFYMKVSGYGWVTTRFQPGAVEVKVWPSKRTL